jgi:class 3 adenylate cyclase
LLTSAPHPFCNSQHLLERVASRMCQDAPPPLVERHECVSVIFADVVGWTQRAAGMSPEEAMRLLDRLWQRFDTLCSSHGTYKVRFRYGIAARLRVLACMLTCMPILQTRRWRLSAICICASRSTCTPRLLAWPMRARRASQSV